MQAVKSAPNDRLQLGSLKPSLTHNKSNCRQLPIPIPAIAGVVFQEMCGCGHALLTAFAASGKLNAELIWQLCE